MTGETRMELEWGEIEDRFVEASRTEALRHVHGVGPAKVGSAMPEYRHTQAEVFRCGGKRFQEEREAFFRRLREKVSPEDITRLHECERWVAAFVTSVDDRRALWGWARSKAKVKASKFKDWCKAEGITTQTGRRRKNDAVEQIMLGLSGKRALHEKNVPKGVLHEQADLGHFSATPGKAVSGETARFTWRDDPSLRPPMEVDESARDTKWAEKQNERRRQRTMANDAEERLKRTG